jgi:hypothetical protein
MRSIALIGALAVPVLGGLLPMLTLFAARRRRVRAGRCSGLAWGSPDTVVGVVSLFGIGVLVQPGHD